MGKGSSPLGRTDVLAWAASQLAQLIPRICVSILPMGGWRILVSGAAVIWWWLLCPLRVVEIWSFGKVDWCRVLGAIVPRCGLLAQARGERGQVAALPLAWCGDRDVDGGQAVPVFAHAAGFALREGPTGVVGARADPELA
jgi:hypothetical protein